MEKLQKALMKNLEHSVDTEEFMTLDEIISSIKYTGNKISLGKILKYNGIYSRIIKIDRKSTRVYYVRLKDRKKRKASKLNSKLYKKDELKNIIFENFMHSETEFLTNMQIGYMLNKIKPDLKTNMRRIGRMLNDMGFKPGQKMIKGMNHRIYFIKRVEQHTDILEELF